MLIGNTRVGEGCPVYFIADIAANWDGSIERAKGLIHMAADCGANAAKFQNFTANMLISESSFNTLSLKTHQSDWDKSVFEVYKDASLPIEWARELMETCKKAGIDYITTPYSLESIAELSRYVCAWKIGSGDITYHEEIELLAQDGKPLLMSTGASSMNEVGTAVYIATDHSMDLVLMQCNTNYTSDNFRYIALNVLRTYRREFPNLVLGLSDHTPGHATVLGAIALGARVIEKHFTDDSSRQGPDHKFSMDPAAWREMVDRSRELEAALGPSEKYVMDNEKDSAVVQRRSIHVNRSMAKDEIIAKSDLIMLRPALEDSFAPYMESEIIGKILKNPLSERQCLRRFDIE